MMNRTLTFLLLVFCLPAITTVTARETKNETDNVWPVKAAVELKFNLQPGEKYLFSSVVKQEITQEAMGQQIITTQDIVTDYIYAVKGRENGVTEIDVMMDALKMDTDVGGMQRITFDSSDPDAGTAELKAMSDIIGKSFQLFVNDDGSVQKIVGFAELFGTVEGPGGELLKQSFGDSSLVQSMNQITNIYPDKAVDVGDAWVKTFSGSIANLLHSEATSNITLSELNGDIALLAVDSRLTFSKLAGTGGNPMLESAEFDMSGTQRGTMEVDVKSGLPIRSKLKQDITGKMNMQGMEIPMTITSDITTTGKKL